MKVIIRLILKCIQNLIKLTVVTRIIVIVEKIENNLLKINEFSKKNQFFYSKKIVFF